jgi:hypothetical protein
MIKILFFFFFFHFGTKSVGVRTCKMGGREKKRKRNPKTTAIENFAAKADAIALNEDGELADPEMDAQPKVTKKKRNAHRPEQDQDASNEIAPAQAG